jgi:hypothetical protein
MHPENLKFHFCQNNPIMCQFQQLHFSDLGYVVKCNACGHYQVGFASTLLTLKAEDYRLLRDIVSSRITENNSFPDSEIKSNIIPTPYKGVNLYLSEKELAELYGILDEAHTEEQVAGLMQLFNG